MKSGYDKFFIKAKENATEAPVPVERTSAKYSSLISKKRLEKNKNKKSFPLMPIFSFGIGVIFIFLLIEKFDDIESYISKIEIGLGSAQAADVLQKTEKAEAKNENDADKNNNKDKITNADVKSDVKSEAAVDIKEDNADYLFKLAERKKELDTRELDLNKKSDEIAKQKIEIEDKLKQLDEYRDKISNMLKDRITADSSKVDNLVQVYSNMKPNQAAKVFETMDEDLVIEILSRMKKKNAADILNLVKVDKAQNFSERYTGYRVPAHVANTLDKEENSNDNKKEMKPKP